MTDITYHIWIILYTVYYAATDIIHGIVDLVWSCAQAGGVGRYLQDRYHDRREMRDHADSTVTHAA